MNKTIYYIEDIYQPVRQSVEDNNTNVYVLLNDVAADSYRLEYIPFESLVRNQRGYAWLEGNFVYYEPNEFGYRVFRSANTTIVARNAFRFANTFINDHRNQLLDDERAIINPNNYTVGSVTSVKSYHVNMGHGNCSIIVINRDGLHEIWMVDCSTREIKGNADYTANIDAAISDITSDYGRNEKFHIDRFILTHKHYDHYNGLVYLIRKKFIDAQTIIYSNLYYICASSTFQKIHKTIPQGLIIIEPSVFQNNQGVQRNQVLRFLCPDRPFVAKNKFLKNKPNTYIEVSKANLSSMVAEITIAGYSMIFPGDQEIEGFKEMSKTRNCSAWFSNANYYCISHHGSINGHPNTDCLGTHYFPNISCCVGSNKSLAILMGRDGAYKGIYDHHTVIPFWGTRLIHTEHDKKGKSVKFAVLDWSTDNVSYGY